MNLENLYLRGALWETEKIIWADKKDKGGLWKKFRAALIETTESLAKTFWQN